MGASYEQFRQMKPSGYDLAGQPRFHKPDLRLRHVNNILYEIGRGENAFLVDPDSKTVSLYTHIHSIGGVGLEDLPDLLQQQSGFVPDRWNVLEFRACDPVVDDSGNRGIMVRVRSKTR